MRALSCSTCAGRVDASPRPVSGGLVAHGDEVPDPEADWSVDEPPRRQETPQRRLHALGERRQLKPVAERVAVSQRSHVYAFEAYGAEQRAHAARREELDV